MNTKKKVKKVFDHMAALRLFTMSAAMNYQLERAIELHKEIKKIKLYVSPTPKKGRGDKK